MTAGHQRTEARGDRPSLIVGLVLTLATALTAHACGSDGPTEPEDEGTPTETLTFLRPAADAPDLLTDDTTVVAVRGEDLQVELFYADESDPPEPGQRFLRFELDDESLLRYPEDHPRQGARFEEGDTVSIRISVGRDTLWAEFRPTGLRFSSDEPAELEISYREADRDFDGDGEEDPDLEDEIGLWRQEAPGEPWFRIGTLEDLELDELKATLTSFTVYALAI